MLWIKAFHIIFVVFWYAGLLYLPRLFVYHAQGVDEASDQRFQIMERKLYAIMTIGALGAIFFGVWLLVVYFRHALVHSGWMHAKLALVAVLIGFHVYCRQLMLAFRQHRNLHSSAFFRWINEIPALILIAVVVLVVVKPF